MKTIKEIIEILDKTVIGQNEAKKELAIAATMQQMRHYQLFISQAPNVAPIKLPVILLAGQSGTGKTTLVRSLAAAMNAPLLEIDVTSCSPPGWSGKTSTDEFEDLHKQIQYMVQDSLMYKEFASVDGGEARSIIFLDEFDKLFVPSEPNEKGYHKEKIFSWLKIIEGKIISKKDATSNYKLNTENMLFILGGAFSYLEEVLAPSKQMGFVQTDEKTPEIEKDIMKKLGFPDELMGRVTSVVKLNSLTIPDLKRILLLPTGIIQQYKDFARMYGVELIIKESDIETIVTKALEGQQGARKLEEITFKYFKDKLATLDYNQDMTRLVFL